MFECRLLCGICLLYLLLKHYYAKEAGVIANYSFSGLKVSNLIFLLFGGIFIYSS